MSNLMEWEKMRWRSMTQSQLQTRLRRITRCEKLRCFAELAVDAGDLILIEACYIRAKQVPCRDVIRYLNRVEVESYYKFYRHSNNVQKAFDSAQQNSKNSEKEESAVTSPDEDKFLSRVIKFGSKNKIPSKK